MLLLFILSIYFPIDSWQNEVLEEIQVRGEHFTNTPSIRPYSISLDRDKPCPYISVAKCSCTIYGATWLHNRLWLANLSADYKCDTIKVLRLKPAIFYDWSNFSLFLQPVVKFGKDSLPPDNVFAGLYSSDYERAYVKFHHPYFGIFIGRERFALGPSPRYNLLLSGYSSPMDWFQLYLQTKVVRLSFYLSRLDDIICKPYEYLGDTITQIINARRYLSIRRLDVSPTNWLNFSFSEAATFGGEDFALAPYHFNPVILLHAYQYNWAKDVNLFFHLDGRIFLKNLSFYGALLVDDFQLEQDPNNEPNHLGINLGAEFADLFIKKTFLIVEYTVLSRYIYCHFIPYQRYQYLNTPIGSPFGPDNDEVYTKLVYHLNPRFDLYSQISYLRKGKIEVDSLWPIPEPRVVGTLFPDDNFLSGIVQKSFDFGLGFRFFKGHILAVDFFMGYSIINNFQHKLAETKNSPILRLKIDLINLSKNSEGKK